MGEQRGADALVAAVAMDQHLGKIGAVRLVWRARCNHLHSADETARAFGHKQDALALCSALGHTGPEAHGLGARQTCHERHGCAARHAVEQDVSEFADARPCFGWISLVDSEAVLCHGRAQEGCLDRTTA